MKSLSRKKKILGFVALAVLVLLLAPFVAVQIQERIFRHRAEQLLADMRSLMMHKASLAEIQAVLRRWNPDEVPCSENGCWFETYLSYTVFEGVNQCADEPGWRHQWLRLFRWYGGRLAGVRARALVEHGVVRNAMFEIGMENFVGPQGAYNLYCTKRPADFEGWFSGLTAIASHFSVRSDWRGLALHPDYFVEVRAPRATDVPPPTIEVLFGPHADPSDVARLANFDLSYLTRLNPSREPGDLMPAAAAQYAREEPLLAQARKEHACGPKIVGLMARDAEYESVVEMTANWHGYVPGLGNVPGARVRVIENLGLAGGWKPGEIHPLEIFDATTDRPATTLPAELRAGNQFIVLAQGGWNPLAARAERCGIVPLNPANLEVNILRQSRRL